MSRYLPFAGIVVLTVLAALLIEPGPLLWWSLAILVPLGLLGVWNLFQQGHTLMRNFPISAHIRWFFEWLRPFMRQYIVEGDREGLPFDHDQRALVYMRAKNQEGLQPFGTEADLYSPRYEWLNHAIRPAHCGLDLCRVNVGGSEVKQPYSASVLNISAMSFGSLGHRAIEALNLGAKMGGFFHDTGEGGLSRYHLMHGGDLVWEVGTGYFGCRTPDGHFDPDQFADRAAHDAVKMVELKLSQGAKPGHGGILPGAKVTAEIAAARNVAIGEDCVSPPGHSAFDTPVGLLEMIARMRELSGGKPAGFKLCIGHRWEFLAICKAMRETGITPDFIVVDGAEGGTGAAPAELSDHVGTPLREGLVFAVNALVGTGLRDKVKLAASGKVASGYAIAANLALGADWCNAARPFMFALGCVQSQKCHTDRCPTGVATQNALLQRGLVVPDKAPRVHNFHHNTVKAFADMLGAAGMADPAELAPHHLRVRLNPTEVFSADKIYEFLKPGQLLDDPDSCSLGRYWAMADASSFAPKD